MDVHVSMFVLGAGEGVEYDVMAVKDERAREDRGQEGDLCSY